MLGDSLLDFVHILTVPAYLFDTYGRLLYANRAALAYDTADKSVLDQVTSQLFPVASSSSVNNIRILPSDGPDHARPQPHLPRSIITTRLRLNPEHKRIHDYTAARPHLARRTSAASTSSATDDDECGTPTGLEGQHQLLWKITATLDKRVLALAQDSLHDPLPVLVSEDDQNALRLVKPVVELPWQLQQRFQPLLRGEGVMAELIRNYDWASHPLGRIEIWPQARVELVGMILASYVPMTAYLEEEGYVLYNDAFCGCLGPSKHPSSLGKPAHEVWGEIWPIIEPLMRETWNGTPVKREDQLLFWERLRDGGPNVLEEVYATWYYTPYFAQDRVIGNLLILFEQQEKQNPISTRRTAVIAELSASLSASRSTIDLCRNTLEVLARLDTDLPYCMAYTKVAYEPPELLTPTEGTVGASPDPYISISSAGSISSRDVEEQKNIHVFALQETVGCAFDSLIAPSRIMIDTDDEAQTPSIEGKPRDEVVEALSTGVWQKAVTELVNTREMVEVTGVHLWLKDVPHRGLPGLKPYRAVLLPLNQGGEVVGFVIALLNPALPWSADFQTFISITARQINLSLTMVRTFEQESQRAEELAALDRAKTSFFTSISHELRTPLTLILGPIKDLTNDSTLTRSQASSISLVYRNARRLLRLVNSILDFARAEAGKLSSSFSPTNLGDVTMELASSFRSAVEGAGMTFITENRVPEDVLVWVDIDKWEKIVFNLISNAFKFTTQGSISIATHTDVYYFYLEVTDTGIGIPPNELSSIFERFVRVENSQARSIEGTGIGLSLTLELVKAHGGKIGVESVWQKGSTFRLKIPLGNGHLPRQYLVNPNTPNSGLTRAHKGSDDYKLHNSEDVTNNPGPYSASGTGTRSESITGTDDGPEGSTKSSDLWPALLFGERQRARILLADDNADLRLFIRGILGKYADITEAYDGRMAWEMMQRENYDLLLSDIMMPRMTGFQLLAEVRASEKHKSIPVILLSARAGEEAGVESLSSGADDHLNKPFSSKELILRVHSHLQLAAIRSELETRVCERTAALEESKETFQRLSELLQVGVHRSDIDGRIIWANRKWFDVLGLEYGNWDNWGSRIHPEDLPSAEAYYSKAVETGAGYEHPIEMRLLGANDAIVDITYELQAEKNALGDAIGFVGVFSDVSNLRKLERERVASEQSRREEAEQNRQLQEEFIDVTCHELRNPLNAISNSAELLGDSLNRFLSLQRTWSQDPTWKDRFNSIEEDIKEDLDAVETILLSSRHQKRIADDVLHVSKISGNLVQLVQNEWKPAESVRQTLKMFNLEVQAKSISLILERDPSFTILGETVIGDEGRFTQVCVNLLSNAIKFLEGAPKKEIRVRIGATPILPESELHRLFDPEAFTLQDLNPLCEPYRQKWPADANATEAYLHVAVQDTGPGMSMEEQGRIFKRYAQASPKTYREFGGVGLGLWISRRLVELHGGAVSLQSVKGVGTVFRLYIKVGRVAKSSISGGSALDPALSDYTNGPSPTQSLDSGLQLSRSHSSSHSTTTSSFVSANRVQGRKPRILVVEDNDVNLKVLVRLLTTMQCDVSTARDGAECIAKIESVLAAGQEVYPYFDLIFMDLEMPVMDGLTATQNIRASEAGGQHIGKRVTIVAVSANARQVYAEMSTQAGMDGFLRKPYSKAQLAEIVNKFVSQKEEGK